MTTQETYRQQLARIVKAISIPDREDLLSEDLGAKSLPKHIKLFVEGNVEKRIGKVGSQLQFVADSFDNFPALIEEYLRSKALISYATGVSDSERMLVWLTETKSLSPVQQDHIACQRARHAVEMLARVNRLKHVRFQELHSVAQLNAAELETNRTLRVYLNPISVWTRFVTDELIEEQTQLPIDVLFFAARDQVATAILESEGRALVKELADFQPCTIDEWATWSNLADREELIEFTRSLAEMGLVALG